MNHQSRAQDHMKAAHEAEFGNHDPQAQGAFTSRINEIALQSERFRNRLRAVLSALRVPPPSPIEGHAEAQRQSCVEDHLQRTESANESINAAINELEGLFQ